MHCFQSGLWLLFVLFALGCTSEEAPQTPACPEGQLRCAGRCVSLNDDAANCGACGDACTAAPHALPLCIDGSCRLSCAPGYTDCNVDPRDGCEADQLTDLAHCGTCGHVCAFAHAEAGCAAGRCVMGACAPGFADCDHLPENGCEADLTRDQGHCGSCDVGCDFANAAAECSAGSCRMGACRADFADCDGSPSTGCETAIGTSANCGGCGRACPASIACVAGACAGCMQGYTDCNANRADGCEIRTSADIANCGTCGNACVPGMSCVEGRCVGCPTGTDDCNRNATDGCETRLDTTENCGACRAVCDGGQHGTAACEGACVVGCEAGFANCGGWAMGCAIDLRRDVRNCGACGHVCSNGERCDAGVCGAGRIRLIGPLSGSRVTSTHPRLRWALPAGVGAARLEVCRDRACASVIEAADVTGTEASVTSALSAGVAFWRMRPLASGALRDSPVWEFFVPWQSAPNGFAHGIVPDFNGDGRADLAVTDIGSGETRVFLATPTGLVRALTLARPPDGLERLGGRTSPVSYTTSGVIAAGDVDGDGFVDMIVTHTRSSDGDGWRVMSRLDLHPGSPSGPLPEPRTIMYPESYGLSAYAQPLGDFNRDGYADLLVNLGVSPSSDTEFGVFMGAEGLPSIYAPPTFGSLPRPEWIGDFDGDGTSDLVISGNTAPTFIRLGVVGTPIMINPGVDYETSPSRPCRGGLYTPGDIDGDGLDDVMVQTVCGSSFLLRWTPSLTHEPLPTPVSVNSVGDLDADGLAELFDTSTGAPGTTAPGLWHRDEASHGWRTVSAPPGAFPGGGVVYLGAGDMTGDGIDDLLVYSFVRAEDPRTYSAQRIDVYAGSRSGLGATPWSTVDWLGARGPLAITRLR